ncbi:hypothetical protein GCM10027168_12210 [Streptomyces capparidis]
MSRGRNRHEEIERRLREALEARAGGVDRQHLRPAALPTGSGRSFPAPRRTVVALFGLAAAAACVLLAVTDGGSDSPVRPAVSPSHSTSPPTSPAPASPAVPVPPPGGAATAGAPDPASPAGARP